MVKRIFLCIFLLSLFTLSFNSMAKKLSDSSTVALLRSFKIENKTGRYYEAVLKKYPDTKPFSLLIQARKKANSGLIGVIDYYLLPITDDIENPPIPEVGTLNEACRQALEMEKEKIQFYENDIIPMVAGQKGIRSIIERLMGESAGRHIPALKRCS